MFISVRFWLALAVAFCGLVAAAMAKTRCADLDRAVTEKLKPLIERTDVRSTSLASDVMRDLGWARLDCRDGRLRRAEISYQQMLAALKAYPQAEARVPAAR
jgi:hypothetical protein